MRFPLGRLLRHFRRERPAGRVEPKAVRPSNKAHQVLKNKQGGARS